MTTKPQNDVQAAREEWEAKKVNPGLERFPGFS